MPRRVSVEIDPGIGRELARSRGMAKLSRMAAEAGAQAARSKAPHVTGALEGSIRAGSHLEPDGWIGYVSAGTRKRGWHAALVELGTTRRPATPYLRPGAEAGVRTVTR